MPLNYYFFWIGIYFVRIKPGHNSRLYTPLHNIRDTDEKNKTDRLTSPVNASTTVTNKAENSSSYFNHGGGKRGYT